MKNRNRQELGMRSFGDDPDTPSDHEWDVLDTLNEDEDEEETEMKTDELAMQHACATCGEVNEILPPRGHKFVRKSEIEREFEKLDEAFRSDIALAFRESYAKKLRRRSCPLPT